MRSNTTCWHGFTLVEGPHPERPGWVQGVAEGCPLCGDWVDGPYLKDPHLKDPPAEAEKEETNVPNQQA